MQEKKQKNIIILKVVVPMSANENFPDFIKSTGYGTGGGLCGWN